MAPEQFHLIGAYCDKYYLQRAETDERLLVPRVDDRLYFRFLKQIILKDF
jgi:hypothetical protein